MVNVKPESSTVNITVSSSGTSGSVNVTPDYAQYYSEKAREWATKMGGMVNNEDYSAKYYANQSKASAKTSQNASEEAKGYSENAETQYNLVVEKADGLDTKTEQLKEEIIEVTEQEKAELELKGQEVKQDIEDDIKSQVDYVNDNLATIDEKLNNVTNTVLSHNMFDVVMKDHILTFEESKGLVAFGDYAYKTGSAGTRYGYPEFYERCIKEYNEAKDYQMPYSTKLIMNGNVVCRDTRIGEGKEGQIYLTNFSTENYASFNTYYGLPFAEPQNENYDLRYTITFRTGENISTQQCLFGWQYGIYLGIDASKLHFYASSNGTSWNIASSKVGVTTLLPNTEYEISLINTNGYYVVLLTGNGVDSTEIEISNTTQINTNNAQKMKLGLYEYNGALQYPFLGDIIISDASYRNPATELYEFNGFRTGFYYEYTPDAVNDFDTVHYYYPLLTTPVKYHNNKHIYYNPIENIDSVTGHPIDYLYNQTGMAWLYGIDTTNERVRMPRNDKYFMCGDAGEMIQAGLPNITGELTVDNSKFNAGSFYSSGKSSKTGATGDDGAQTSALFDASRSSSVYGNSDTVQTDAVKLMGYICAGNTEIETASAEVTEVTTTENDTVPLFTGMYFDFKPNNISWLAKDTTQAKSGKIYETTYNELVKCLNVVDNKYNIKVIDVADMVDGTDYSLYWKVDQVNMTFTTPSKWGLVSALTGTQRVLVAKKEPTETDSTWYNLYSDGWLEQGGRVTGVAYNSTTQNLTFLKSFRDTNYSASTTVIEGANSINGAWVNEKTTTGMIIKTGYQGSNTQTHLSDWKACGYTEIPSVEDYTEDVYLYFKVGNAVANQELIDVGELTEVVNNKIDINSGYVDGQWEGKAVVLSTDMSAGTTEIDMSEYLPKDDFDYDVQLLGHCSSGDTRYWFIYSDIIPRGLETMGLRTTSGATQQGSYIRIPVGKQRKLYFYKSAAFTTDTALLGIQALGYRRLGKNQ